MFQSMSRHIEAAEAAAILQAITDEHPVTQDDVLAAMAAENPNVVLPPPVPPTLMTLTIYEKDKVIDTYRDVRGSSLAGPTTFRFETLDDFIILMDMNGRDFILEPQS